AIAMAADVPIAGCDRGGRWRIRLEGAGTAEDRHRNLKTGEDPMQSPEPDAGAIFEHAFGGEVAAADPEIAADHLGQPSFRHAVSSGVRELRAFLEIDNEIDGDPSIAGPSGVGRLAAVADKVSRHVTAPVAALLARITRHPLAVRG